MAQGPTPTAAALLRPATAADAASLAALATQVWLDTYATDGVSGSLARYVQREFTPAQFERLSSEPSCTLLVAEVRQHLVAYALLGTSSPCPNNPALQQELSTLYVQRHFAGHGIGAALLQACTAQVRTGGNRLWLTVNARNAAAIAFYERQGFVRTGSTDFVLEGVAHENHIMVAPAA